MLTVIMGAYFNVFITFPNVSMTYPILVYSIVGLYSLSYGICIKAFMAVNGENFLSNQQQMVSNCARYICQYYNSYISVAINFRLVLFI